MSSAAFEKDLYNENAHKKWHVNDHALYKMWSDSKKLKYTNNRWVFLSFFEKLHKS